MVKEEGRSPFPAPWWEFEEPFLLLSHIDLMDFHNLAEWDGGRGEYYAV